MKFSTDTFQIVYITIILEFNMKRKRKTKQMADAHAYLLIQHKSRRVSIFRNFLSKPQKKKIHNEF